MKNNLNYIIKNHSSQYDFVTADGGFDYSVDFNKQEENSINLIFCEILYALILQKSNGSFILKIFDSFHVVTVEMLYVLCVFYKDVTIYKPSTSREANSEKYIICRGYTMLQNRDKIIKSLIESFDKIKTSGLKKIFKHDMNDYFLNRIKEMNAVFGQQQIESISLTLNHIKENSLQNKERIEKIKMMNVRRCVKWCIANEQKYQEFLVGMYE